MIVIILSTFDLSELLVILLKIMNGEMAIDS